jgi:hypothetical protein
VGCGGVVGFVADVVVNGERGARMVAARARVAEMGVRKRILRGELKLKFVLWFLVTL